ncbi:MAG: hypothetical protein WD673_14030 [Alphaproteobacteria bacterium]
MDWTTVRAWLAGLFGLVLLLGLLFVGFFAAVVELRAGALVGNGGA